MKNKIILVLALVGALTSMLAAAFAQGTAFTYQGRLNDGGNLANGNYDLKLTLFDAATNGNTVAGPVTNTAVAVSNGLFTTVIDFGAAFDGNPYWLRIQVRTNGANNFITLSPRQQLSPTPYAEFATTASNLSGTISFAQLPSGLVTNNESSLTLAGNFSGNGAGLTNVNAATLNGLAPGAFWQLGGNAISGGQFIGSQNNQPVEIWAASQRALRLEPNPVKGAPNVIGGSLMNYVAGSASSATIAGGGASNYSGFPYTNTVTADFGTVGGGGNNTAGNGATVAGGMGNTASGSQCAIGGGGGNSAAGSAALVAGGADNTASANFATVAGGLLNSATAPDSTVAGGFFNNATKQNAMVGGGQNNTANGNSATVGGGQNNTATGTNATVAGGAYNSASRQATVGGGFTNTAGADYATVGGGYDNAVSGEFGIIAGGNNNTVTATSAAVGGGYNNTASGQNSVVSGGGGNTASGFNSTVGGGWINQATLDYASVAGGLYNSATGTNATVGGGYLNTATNSGTVAGGENNNASGISSTVAGGENNNAGGVYSTVAGGNASSASGYSACVSGGGGNTASGDYSVVAGGQVNIASGYYATVAGGAYNRADGQGSFAAGTSAEAGDGCFVWSDGSQHFTSTANNQFLILASDGVGINMNTPNGDALSIGGTVRLNNNALFLRAAPDINHGICYFGSGGTLGNAFGGLSPDGPVMFGFGGGALGTDQNGTEHVALSWTTTSVTVNGTFNNNSDRNAKQDFKPVSAAEVLEKVSTLPVSEWSYKTDAATRHIGPMAQDFYAAFNIGTDEKHIAPIDEGGVALAAIQGLNQKLNEKDAEIKQLKEKADKVDSLEKQLNELKRMVQLLAEQEKWSGR